MRLMVETFVKAPRETVFDLARDVEAHIESSRFTKERVVKPGRTSGLLEQGELVTFEGVHLGVRQRLTAKVVEMNRPMRFVDEQVRGAFAQLRHLHEFEEHDGGTLMRDTLDWVSPLWLLGKMADRWFVRAHMKTFLIQKQNALKLLAEQR